MARPGTRRFARDPVIRWTAAATAVLWLGLVVIMLRRTPGPDDPTQWQSFGMYDYRDTVWLPIRDFMNGGQPWQPQAYAARHPNAQIFPLYLVFYWLFLWPLALMPYHLSLVFWLVVLAVSYAVVVLVPMRMFLPRLVARAPWLPGVLMVLGWTMRPVRTAFSLGQLALPCAAGAAVALLATRASRRALAGTVVALIKPPVGLALVLALAATRRVRTALTGIVVAGVMLVPVLATMAVFNGGPGQVVHDMITALDEGAGGGPNLNTHTDVAGTLENIDPGVSSAVTLVGTVVAAVLLLVAAFIAARRFGLLAPQTVTITALEMVLVTPNILYCAISLIPAMVCLAAVVLDRRVWPRDRWVAVVLLVLIAVPEFNSERFFTAVGLGARYANITNGVALAIAGVVCALWILSGREPLPTALASEEPFRGGSEPRASVKRALDRFSSPLMANPPATTALATTALQD